MIRLMFFSLFIVSLFIMQGCSETSPAAAAVMENKPPAAALQQATVISDQPPFVISLPGELMPYEQVSIYPKIKGFVKKIYVDRGTYVRKGQLLARLEAAEIGEQLAARQSATNTAYQKYLFSKQAYGRLKEASLNNGAVATIELEKAYAAYLGDSAAYNSSRSEAAVTGQFENYLRITAPFSGVITGRFISEGALVGENATGGSPLFQLAQQEKLRLTVAIPEKQAQSLQPGAKATFKVIDLPGKTFDATLSRNSGALDVASRSIIAEFDLPATGTGLRAGQYAKVTIQLKRPQPTLWVPASSVVQAQSGVFVIKNEKGSTRRVPVQTGVQKDTLMEVFGDLQAGDKILLKGSEEVKEGMSVTL